VLPKYIIINKHTGREAQHYNEAKMKFVK